MKIYAIIWGNVRWTIFMALMTGKFHRLDRALDYLKVRQNREFYRMQLRGWELDRRLEAIRPKLKVVP